MDANADRFANLSPVKRAFLALEEAQARIQALEAARSEPIAIVGMACRFPGGAATPEAFWQLLHDGVDASCDTPLSRWDAEAYYDPDPDAPGKLYTRRGSYLTDDIGGFDAAFFGISPREVLSLDPQHRLLLEVAWEALEDAGQVPDQLVGSQTGVFLGLMTQDYFQLHIRLDDLDSIDPYTGSGNGYNFAAGRLSYLLGLQGPSMALDTACSSSLVAIHLACQSLRLRECNLALAGGVNLMLAPDTMVYMCRLHALAPDGRCKTFDASADGYARGEGCGIVALKRLSDAQAANDPILAVIRGSAINHAGPSGGLTIPNGLAQQAVIRQALAHAHISSEQISYIEAHGTGTSLGDPIELRALAAVLGQRPPERPVVVGSVKTNIGHLEAAAGVAGLMKVVLSLQHGEIPPHLHFTQPNPQIPWSDLSIAVPTKRLLWRAGEADRTAGLSAFGLSGINAHLIVQEAPKRASTSMVQSHGPYWLPLSARSSEALRALASAYREKLQVTAASDLADLCYTAGARRSHHPYRLALTFGDREEAIRQLAALEAGHPVPGVSQGPEPYGSAPRLAWIFPHAETVALDVVRALVQHEMTFRIAAEACDVALQPHLGYSVLAKIQSAEMPAARSSLMFVTQLGLAAIWRAWGLEPAFVIGQGTGEVAAAYTAGVFSLEEAARVIARWDTPEPASGLLETQAARVPYYSATLDRMMTGTEMDASYWAQLRTSASTAPIVIERVVRDGYTTFVVLNPTPCERTDLIQSDLDSSITLVSSLPSSESGACHLFAALSELYVVGCTPAWAGFYPNGGRCVALPNYPWQRERYWREFSPRRTISVASEHPLLGAHVELPVQPGGQVWGIPLASDELHYLRDHQVGGAAIVPAAAYVEAALAVAKQVFADRLCRVAHVTFEQQLLLEDADRAVVQLVLEGYTPDHADFRIVSRAAGSDTWTTHVRGSLQALSVQEPIAAIDLAAVRARCSTSMEGTAHYQWLRDYGLNYGPSFQGVERVWRGAGEALAQLQLPATVRRQTDHYELHPALLDAALQVVGHSLTDRKAELLVPVALDTLQMYGSVQSAQWAYVVTRELDNTYSEVYLLGADGQVCAVVQGLRLQAIGAAATQEEPWQRWLYDLQWRAQPLTGDRARVSANGYWLIVRSTDPVCDHLVSALDAHGERCVVLSLTDNWSSWFAQAEEGCAGVLYLPGLEAGDGIDRVGSLCAGVVDVVQRMAQQGWRTSPRLWLITRGAQRIAEHEAVVAQQTALWGLGRTIVYEHPELACTRLDLDPHDQAAQVEALLAELLTTAPYEDQVAWRAGQRYVARLAQWTEPPPAAELTAAGERAFRLEMDRPGVLDQLQLRAMPQPMPGAGEVTIEVHAASLNFIDVLKALGVYPGQENAPLILGGECAGRIVATGEDVAEWQIGDEVVALGAHAMASHVITRAAWVAHKPDGLSWAQAAAIPLVFMTAYHALVELARLQAGERVLIHSAASGTGLAAVQIAQRLGAEVWATAGTVEKRAYLQSLGVQHVMDSRSLAFAAELMAATDGQGVDVVLNSLTGAAVEKSLEVLGRYGRFVEIGKKDIYEKRALSLQPFQRALSYFAVDLAGLTVHRPAECARLFQSVMGQVKAGDIQPVPVRTFEMAEAVEAFRYMAQGKHTGKIAITVTDRARVPIVVRRTEEQGRIRPDGSYLITGGLGGLGLKVAEWLIQRGARDVVLVGRRGASEETERLLATWRVPGVRVEAVAADVSQAAEVARLLNIVRTQHGPLRGIIHAAGILDDGVVLKQTADRFERVLGPKAYGAWLLHQQTLTDELDFFVLFSSAASLLGSPGQGNYAAANAFLDGLAQHRVAQGLPGLSINWGAWSEVGMAAAQAQRGERIAQNGLGSLSPAEGLTALDYVLQQATGQIGVMALNVRQWRQVYPRAAQLPMLTELFTTTAREGVPTQTTGQLCQTLSELPADQRRAALERYLREELAKVLRLKIDRIGRDAPLQGLGLDSLMALELRNRLEDNLGLQLAATLIWAHPTVSALASYLLTRLGLQVETPPTPEPAAPQFSAEEGDAILKKLAALKQAMN